jgi:hypothetical protein
LHKSKGDLYLRKNVLSVVALLVFSALATGSLEDSDSPKTSSETPGGTSSSNRAAADSERQEIDVRKLGLTSRAKVEQQLGKPDKDADRSPDIEGYSWGSVKYERGILKSIDYHFKSRPTSPSQALRKIGLDLWSNPSETGLSYVWNPTTTGKIECCGYEFTDIVVPRDLSAISVGFKRRARHSAVKESEPSPAVESGGSTDSSLGAELACRRAIRETFVDADLGWVQSPNVRAVGRDRWRISFEAEGENAFGGKVRQIVTCDVKCSADDCIVRSVN